MAKNGARQAPSAAEISAALSRLLGSRAFQRAGRSSAFLRFVVEEALAGRGDRLKGFTIAVEVFGRSEDFDAQTDPLVRVEAGRLRRRLSQYYEEEGGLDPIRIKLSRGGYLPSFRYAPTSRLRPAEDAGDPATESKAARASGPDSWLTRHRRSLVNATVGGIAIIGIVALLSWPEPPTEPEPGTGQAAVEIGETLANPPMPRMIILPVTNIGNDPAFDSFAAGLTEEVILALVGFNIVATASPAGLSIESGGLGSLREDFDAGYALTGSVRTAANEIRVAIRLVETDAGTQLWTRTFDETIVSGGELAAQESIAVTIATIMASPFGPIFGREIEKTADKPAVELDPYECLLRFYGYAKTFSPALHADGVLCLQRAVLSEPLFVDAWSGLATLYLHEHTFGYDPQPDRGDALERALEAARTALDIDGSNRVAAVTMVGILGALGDTEAFERAVDRALSIRPTHPAVIANVGYSLTLHGDWARGAPMIEQALPFTADVPGWYYVAFAFRDLQTGEYADALDWALRVDAPDWFATPLTVAATAAYAGRLDLAQREIDRLLELYPQFETAGRAQLDNWALNDELIEILIRGLRLAGMEIS